MKALPVLADVVGAAVVVLALWAAVARARALREAGDVIGFDPPVKPRSPPHRPKKTA